MSHILATREDVSGTSVAAHTRGKRGRKPLDLNLPREVVRHELPKSERFCAHDGHALVAIGVEASKQLEVIPEQARCATAAASSTMAANGLGRQWNTVRSLLLAWVLTLPASIVLAAGLYWLFRAVF